MDHPLDDCRLKVARAKQQFDGLHGEIRDFSNEHPYIVNVNVHPDTGYEILDCVEPPRFDPKWGVLVGEMLHNLRSALDYLINEFVIEAGRKPHGNSFPIAKTRSRYLKKGRKGITYRDRCLRGVPGPIKGRIDNLQPYKRGNLAHADMLLMLADFTNRDKHRTPIASYAWVNTPTRVVIFPTSAEIGRFQVQVARNGAITVDADFKGSKRNPPAIAIAEKVKMKRPSSVEVVFGREVGKLVGLDDLRSLVLYVETIIESFGGDFET